MDEGEIQPLGKAKECREHSRAPAGGDLASGGDAAATHLDLFAGGYLMVDLPFGDGEHPAGAFIAKKDYQPQLGARSRIARLAGEFQGKRAAIDNVRAHVVQQQHNGHMMQGAAGSLSLSNLKWFLRHAA